MSTNSKKNFIEKYAFRIPVMFEGDRGSGKTYDVRDFAKKMGCKYLEIAGNESLEAFDFLGHMVPSTEGMVWKDGKMSQAFRLASKGEKVILLIDEMLRIPQKHLSILLSALSPDSDGNLRLQTGRMRNVVDGIGEEEELVCSAKNIAFFATTNVGPEFAVEDVDPAVAERFIIERKDTDEFKLRGILEKKLAHKEFNTTIALKMVEFFKRTEKMVKAQTLNRHATTRTLTRAIDHADTESNIIDILRDQILLWVDRDSAGYPQEEQKKLVEDVIKELFNNMNLSQTTTSTTAKEIEQRTLDLARSLKDLATDTMDVQRQERQQVEMNRAKEVAKEKVDKTATLDDDELMSFAKQVKTNVSGKPNKESEIDLPKNTAVISEPAEKSTIVEKVENPFVNAKKIELVDQITMIEQNVEIAQRQGGASDFSQNLFNKIDLIKRALNENENLDQMEKQIISQALIDLGKKMPINPNKQIKRRNVM